MNIYLYIKKPNLNQQHSAGHQSWQLNVTTINNSASYLSYNKYIDLCNLSYMLTF